MKTETKTQDKPESNKIYQLTGTETEKCISNGNTWQESQVKPKEKTKAQLIREMFWIAN
jgi:hypothetical protein